MYLESKLRLHKTKINCSIYFMAARHQCCNSIEKNQGKKKTDNESNPPTEYPNKKLQIDHTPMISRAFK